MTILHKRFTVRTLPGYVWPDVPWPKKPTDAIADPTDDTMPKLPSAGSRDRPDDGQMPDRKMPPSRVLPLSAAAVRNHAPSFLTPRRITDDLGLADAEARFGSIARLLKNPSLSAVEREDLYLESTVLRSQADKYRANRSNC